MKAFTNHQRNMSERRFVRGPSPGSLATSRDGGVCVPDGNKCAPPSRTIGTHRSLLSSHPLLARYIESEAWISSSSSKILKVGASMNSMPADCQAPILSHLNRPDLLSLTRTHRSLRHEVERQLYRSVVLPVQSTTAPPLRTLPTGRQCVEVLDHESRLEDDTIPRYDHGEFGMQDGWWSDMPTASHHGATVIAPTIFKLPADYIRIPHQLQVEGAHTDVVARQIKCQSFLQALLAGEHRAKYVRHVRLD
jgi:hypothetical protein